MMPLLRNNLFQRVVVAFAGIPVLLWINRMGGLFFLALVLLLSLVAIFEFRRLAEHRAHPPALSLLLLLTALIQLNFYFRVFAYWEAFLVTVMLLFVLELYRKEGSQLLNLGVTLVGLLYVNLTFGALLRLRMIGDGKAHAVAAEGTGEALVLLMFVCVWATDILAYFGGRTFGGKFIRRKLFERLSPHKTWEGFFSGIAGSMTAALLCASLLPYCPSDMAMMTGLLAGVTSPAGDLMESMFKRDAGVKDASGLIPGHGGVLDRFDTIMFIAPMIYFLAAYR
jgi:phosphatidate cytidylyltransferase